MKTFSDRIQHLTGVLAGTLERKNKDYGDSYAKSVEKRGQGITFVRLEDKLNRLESLFEEGKQEVNEESIDDTLLDLAGYCILELERRMRYEKKL